MEEAERYYRQVEELKQDAEDLTRGLTDEQFNWRPSPEQWSINECLEHLNITARLYWSILAEAVNRARINGWFRHGPYKRGWLGDLVIRAVEPPVRYKFKADRRFQPPAGIPASQVVAQFMTFQDRLLGILRDAHGVDLGRPRIPAPGGRLLKFTLGQAFEWMIAHERRHIWQARNVKFGIKFPKGPEW